MMESLRKEPPKTISSKEVEAISDYKISKTVCLKTGKESEIDLPSSNVLSFSLSGGAR